MQFDDYGYEGAVRADAYDDARAEVKRLEDRWAALRAWLRLHGYDGVLAKMDELKREVTP